MSTRTIDADVSAFLTHIETVRNLSPHTVRAYEGDLGELAAGLREQKIRHANAVDLFVLRKYLTTLRPRGLSPRTIARKISAIRAFFGWLAESGRIQANAAADLRLPRRPKDLPKFLTQDEVRRLLEFEPSEPTWLDARDRAILETLYSSGARVSELAGLDMPDLDLHDGTVLLKGKGRKERLAGLGQPCLDALDGYFLAVAAARARKDKRAVFLNRFGGRLSTRSIARLLDKRVAAAGLRSGVSPHTLRHSFATHMLSAGANLREVQELLGHRSVASTQVYTHLTLDHLMRVYDEAHPRAGKGRA